MKGKRYIIFLGFLTAVMIVAAFVSESIYFSDFEYRFRTRKFNKILVEKEKIMENCLNAMKPILAKEDHHGSITENNLFSIAEQNKITILEYIDNKLVYWSDNEFDVPQFLNDSIYSRNLVFLQNGWFLPKTIRAGNERIDSSVLVKRNVFHTPRNPSTRIRPRPRAGSSSQRRRGRC